MNAWHAFGLTVLAQVTAIALAAAAATALLRRRAPLRHAIGVVALVFLLASPVLTLLLPRASWIGRSDSPPVSTDPDQIEAAQSDDLRAADFTRVIPEPETGDRVAAPPTAMPTAEESASPRHVEAGAGQSQSPARRAAWVGADWKTWLARGLNLAGGMWLAGVLIVGWRWIAARRRLRCLATSAQPATIADDVADEARRALGLARLPPIAVSELAPVPLVLGCWRPRVVLPQQFVETASATRLRDVLIHECAHVRRGDPWIHAAQQLARIVYWPHPGVHWLNRQVALAREEVCDNFVLRRADAVDYAQTLLALAESCGGGRMALSLLGLFSRSWTLEDRIAGILNPRRGTMTRTHRVTPLIWAASISVICVLVGGVGAWGEASQAAKDATAPQTVEADRSTAVVAAGESPTVVKPPDAPKAPVAEKITIQGVCQDQNTKPIPGVRIRVFRMTSYSDPLTLVAEVRTGADGAFSIPNVEALPHPGQHQGMTDLMVAATADGHVSVMKMIDEKSKGAASLVMADNPGTLSGVVTDEHGKPLAGVAVYLNCCGSEPAPEFMSAVTDQQGRYTIAGLKRWKPEDTKTFDPKTGTGTIQTECFFSLKHADYALTRGAYAGIPNEVNVTMRPPAIVEGQVIDQVSGRPLANVEVSAQGVAQRDFGRTRTDESGHYRLLMNRDHYNIWAEADDRIAIAVKALKVEQGKTVKGADIPMVRGGFVVGTVFDGATGKPFKPPEQGSYAAHHGPARPFTGAAVSSTLINADGTYRLRVAPGRNYVYLMSGGTSEYVEVADGGETRLDLRTGEHRTNPSIYDDPDFLLAQKLHHEAREEDEEAARKSSGAPATPKPPKRQRPDTPTGQLLDKLELQNAGSARFHDTWLRTLKAIVDLGPNAVPELIEELDATDNRMMLSCLGFTLRAIGDQRAVPALIRAIPKTLVPAGSDMGLRAEDAELAKWAQQHELNPGRHSGDRYGFGRPVHEIVGALRSLTGQEIGQDDLFHTTLTGTASQQRMKRELFDRTARKWADWWERNAAERVKEPAYVKVNLPPRAVGDAVALRPGTRYKTSLMHSGSILESPNNPKARQVFLDLDTGRSSSLPDKWRDGKDIDSRLDEVIAWAAGEGFDLMGSEFTAPDGTRTFALRGIGLRAWELGSDRWKMQADDVTLEALQSEGTPTDGLLLHRDKQTKQLDPKATATFFYITREGTPGLFFVGIEVQDDSLKPGGRTTGDDELSPVAFWKGRRFGFAELEEIK